MASILTMKNENYLFETKRVVEGTTVARLFFKIWCRFFFLFFPFLIFMLKCNFLLNPAPLFFAHAVAFLMVTKRTMKPIFQRQTFNKEVQTISPSFDVSLLIKLTWPTIRFSKCVRRKLFASESIQAFHKRKYKSFLELMCAFKAGRIPFPLRRTKSWGGSVNTWEYNRRDLWKKNVPKPLYYMRFHKTKRPLFRCDGE